MKPWRVVSRKFRILFLVMVGFLHHFHSLLGSVFQVLNTAETQTPPPKLSYSRVAWEGVLDPELIPDLHSLLLEHTFTPHTLSTPSTSA